MEESGDEFVSQREGKRILDIETALGEISKKLKPEDNRDFMEEEKTDADPEANDSEEDKLAQEQRRMVVVGPDADSDIEMPWISWPLGDDPFELIRVVDWNEKSSRNPLVNINDMVEIFSISFHWKSEVNVAHKFYHLYGYVYMVDMHGYYQKSMHRPSTNIVALSNGGNLPLVDMRRTLSGDPGCFLSVCLKGHRSDSVVCGVNCNYDNEVLVKAPSSLCTVTNSNILTTKYKKIPLEKTVSKDSNHFLRVHYALSHFSYVLSVDVRVVSRGETKRDWVWVRGRITVHWEEFEALCEDIAKYTITLFDSEWADSMVDCSSQFSQSSQSSQSSSSTKTGSGGVCVMPGEPIRLWRSNISVPDGYTLVFGVYLLTDAGDVIDFRCRCFVGSDVSEYPLTLPGSEHNLELMLENLIFPIA